MPAGSSKETGTVSTRISNARDQTDKQLDTLLKIVNISYAKAEEGLWKDTYLARVSRDELRKLIDARELIVAEMADNIVGCVKYSKYNQRVAGLGMLAVDPELRGQRIGSALVSFLEQRAIADGFYTIQLEILEPQNEVYPSKELLKRWYSNLGYRPGSTEPFSKYYPQAHQLSRECNFTIWRKQLR